MGTIASSKNLYPDVIIEREEVKNIIVQIVN